MIDRQKIIRFQGINIYIYIYIYIYYYKLKSSYGTAIYYTSYGTVVFVENGRDDDRISNYAFI